MLRVKNEWLRKVWPGASPVAAEIEAIIEPAKIVNHVELEEVACAARIYHELLMT